MIRQTGCLREDFVGWLEWLEETQTSRVGLLSLLLLLFRLLFIGIGFVLLLLGVADDGWIGGLAGWWGCGAGSAIANFAAGVDHVEC